MTKMKLPTIPDDVELGSDGPGICRHLFDSASRNAILAALGAGRPLLLRGEPGVGKSQLAEAAASVLNRLLLTVVVDSRTESRDLLYQIDTLRRLAEAQLCGALPATTAEDFKKTRQRVSLRRFIAPGPLWWAFDWTSAAAQARRAGITGRYSEEQWENAEGAVLLIDEIDKAEADVPNGLLEALGAGRFSVADRPEPIRQSSVPPLVVITTNEERSLPQAFVRRCVVLTLQLPGEFDEKGRNPQLQQWLVDRGVAHFGQQLHVDVLKAAAEQLVEDRFRAIDGHWQIKPGQAEYLDLLRAVAELDPGLQNKASQLQRLEAIREFILRKDRGDS
jgi:hypothetical protein